MNKNGFIFFIQLAFLITSDLFFYFITLWKNLSKKNCPHSVNKSNRSSSYVCKFIYLFSDKNQLLMIHCELQLWDLFFNIFRNTQFLNCKIRRKNKPHQPPSIKSVSLASPKKIDESLLLYFSTYYDWLSLAHASLATC